MAERRKFAREEVLAAIEEVSRGLDAPIEAFLIGGLAMIIHGTKLATKDVDVVLSSHEMADTFVSACEDYRRHNRGETWTLEPPLTA